jgi:hypothetical protein
LVDFKTLQGFSHYNSISIIPGATLEERQTTVNKDYRKRAKDLDVDLHGTPPAQRGPIEAELNEHRHSGRVLAPVTGLYVRWNFD